MTEDQQPAIHEQDTPPMLTHSQRPLTQAIPFPIPTDISTAHSSVSIGHPPPTAQTVSNLVDSVRFTALEGMVNQLATNMATNMTELMAMLRDQNRASSSFISPPEHRTTADPNLVVPPIHVTDNEDISFSARAYAPTVHPISDPLLLPPAPTAVPLPPAAFLSTDLAMHALPPLTLPMRPPIYTVPPPTVPPVINAQAPVSTMDQFPFQAPQPQICFSYPALPPPNILPTEPSMPTQAAPPAPPINFLSETETEQERRMKKMEETIKALQAGSSRLDYSNSDWNIFPGMRLPPKIKILDFKSARLVYDPESQRRPYTSFPEVPRPVSILRRDSPYSSRSQHDRDKRGSDFRSMCNGVEGKSDLIEAGKKFDMGVKLGRIEGLSRKKDGKTSKK
ncbi:proline-rich protein 36-like [Punica granatum]|uniref:Proline-rich protein 36-like n=1 Tax=Punica granatum TaxID=22663 RepID=A0A6P8DJP9_PUNGR|nr:proline-rich protein 36-like [Punica granatum]